MKPIIQYVHVNKQKNCWTVHSSKGCFHFDSLDIKVPIELVHKPLKKDNPRFFIRCKGTLDFENKRIV